MGSVYSFEEASQRTTLISEGPWTKLRHTLPISKKSGWLFRNSLRAVFTKYWLLRAVMAESRFNPRGSKYLVPNTIKGIVFGTRVFKYWVLGPSGNSSHAAAAPIPKGQLKNEECHPGLSTLEQGRSSLVTLKQDLPSTEIKYSLVLSGYFIINIK